MMLYQYLPRADIKSKVALLFKAIQNIDEKAVESLVNELKYLAF